MNEFLQSWETLSELSRLLQAPEMPGVRARSEALRLLAAVLQADSALLVPLERGQLKPDLSVHWGRKLPLETALDRLREAADSPELLLGPRRLPAASGDVALLRLQWSGERLAVVWFSGPRLRRAAASRRCLLAAASLLAQWELNRRLRRLLTVSERRLRTLTADSRSIAERNEKLFSQMLDHQDRLGSVSKGFIRMQEEERSRVSRELHDGVGQSLTALKINLDLLASEIQGELSPAGQARLQETRKMAAETIEEVRELSRLLRPRMLDELGLLPTLRWLVRSFSQRTGMNVGIQQSGTGGRLDADLETLLFRVAQEGLNNAWKHAGTPSAQIRIEFQPQQVILEISDEGKGIEEQSLDAAVRGSGLPGMRERVSLAGGEFSIESGQGRGTTLKVRVPHSVQAASKGTPR